MNETITPNPSAIADAMLKRTREIFREQAAPETLAEKVINTLKGLGVPGVMISGQKPLDAINALLEAACAEKDKSTAHPGIASYFVNDAAAGARPHYAQIGAMFAGDVGVFPLYFAPVDTLIAKGVERITTARISELWDGMPGGCAGFQRQWGYFQFAQAVEEEVRATVLAAFETEKVST